MYKFFVDVLAVGVGTSFIIGCIGIIMSNSTFLYGGLFGFLVMFFLSMILKRVKNKHAN